MGHSSSMLSLVCVCVLLFIRTDAAPKPKPKEFCPYPCPWPCIETSESYSESNSNRAPQYGDWYLNPTQRGPTQYGDWYLNPTQRGNRQIKCGVDKSCYDNVCQTAAMCNAQHCWWGTPGIGGNPAGTCYPKGPNQGDYPG